MTFFYDIVVVVVSRTKIDFIAVVIRKRDVLSPIMSGGAISLKRTGISRRLDVFSFIDDVSADKNHKEPD